VIAKPIRLMLEHFAENPTSVRVSAPELVREKAII
jgi:hypothetical protein